MKKAAAPAIAIAVGACLCLLATQAFAPGICPLTQWKAIVDCKAMGSRAEFKPGFLTFKEQEGSGWLTLSSDTMSCIYDPEWNEVREVADLTVETEAVVPTFETAEDLKKAAQARAKAMNLPDTNRISPVFYSRQEMGVVSAGVQHSVGDLDIPMFFGGYSLFFSSTTGELQSVRLPRHYEGQVPTQCISPATARNIAAPHLPDHGYLDTKLHHRYSFETIFETDKLTDLGVELINDRKLVATISVYRKIYGESGERVLLRAEDGAILHVPRNSPFYEELSHDPLR